MIAERVKKEGNKDAAVLILNVTTLITKLYKD